MCLNTVTRSPRSAALWDTLHPHSTHTSARLCSVTLLQTSSNSIKNNTSQGYLKPQAEKPEMLCPAFYLGWLLAPGIVLLILSSFANSASQEPVFVSLLASGHDISVVLELAVIQELSVGCAGLGTAVPAGVQSVASPHIAPRAPLPGCAQHFRSAASCQICLGCYFCALNSSQSEVGQISTAIWMSCAQQPTDLASAKLPSCHNSHRQGCSEPPMHKEETHPARRGPQCPASGANAFARLCVI